MAALCVILPAFNEEAGIFYTLKAVAEALPEAAVIVVDDGSSDGTAEIARALGAEVISQANQGHGAALLRGSRAAQSEWLLLLDADGEIDLSHLALHWQEALRSGQAVFGQRPRARQPLGLRRLMSAVLRQLTKIEDANCPYKFIRRAEVLALPQDCAVPLLALALRHRQAQFVAVKSTKARKGRLSLARLWQLSRAAWREIRAYS